MNKLEQAYAAELDKKLASGEILWWGFECIKLVLADKTTYLPDFLVQYPDLEVQIHETKGYWEQHSRVKVKVAASLFPFKLFAIRNIKGRWEVEEFN